MSIAPDIFTQFRSELSFYEGQYLGLMVAFRKGANVVAIQQEIKTLQEFFYEQNAQKVSTNDLDVEVLKQGYESGLWLAMGHSLYPHTMVNRIPQNLRIQGWMTEGIRDGIRFVYKSNFSHPLLQAELKNNEILLRNEDESAELNFGASPRIYQEGYRRGLLNAARLLGY